MKNSDNIIFALDIGTRKVVGMIAQKLNDKLELIDVEVIEHCSRTMLDGQIHNISEVAKVVGTIKERLEKRMGFSLHKVGVAVAGRALKTMRGRVAKEISIDDEIFPDSVRNIELEAVSSLLTDANLDLGEGDSYCVGYSVVNYQLDGSIIGDLTGHFGRNMAVEVIATFLPRVVLDSMFSVLRKTELEVINLTLEPIAAIKAIIPEDMRRLNLALVDIGAGTSDIALTKGGSVIAYGMVPEAGDEITELICEKYILDFPVAEILKRSLETKETVTFTDILGKTYTLKSEEVIAGIKERVNALSGSIAKCILGMNKQSPHAVVLVGGGSLTPELDKKIANSLSLDENKVGIRLPYLVKNIEDKTGKLQGPEMVTPLGICVMTAQSGGLKFIELYVNDKRVHVLDMQQNLDVLSALVAAGINRYKLYGKIGRAICVQVNGQLKIIKGKPGKPAQFMVNGKSADINKIVKNQDRIEFESATDGVDAIACVKDVISVEPLTVTVNDKQVTFEPPIYMGGKEVDLSDELFDRASIEYNAEVIATMALIAAGINVETLEDRQIMVRVNKEPRILLQCNYSLQVNGSLADLNTKICSGSIVTFEYDKPQFYRVRDVVKVPEQIRPINVLLNNEVHTLSAENNKILMNGQKVNPDEFLIDSAEIMTLPGEVVKPTVSNLLEYVPFSPGEQKGKIIKIVVNGQPGGFTTPLSEGAEITIGFVSRH